VRAEEQSQKRESGEELTFFRWRSKKRRRRGRKENTSPGKGGTSSINPTLQIGAPRKKEIVFVFLEKKKKER
jgi:hypothetical protein